MIYATEARAREVAAELNARKGFRRCAAVLTNYGWTVIEGGAAMKRTF